MITHDITQTVNHDLHGRREHQSQDAEPRPMRARPPGAPSAVSGRAAEKSEAGHRGGSEVHE